VASGCDDDQAKLAEASRQLVAADAKSRTEMIALQRDLQQGHPCSIDGVDDWAALADAGHGRWPL